MPPTLNPAGTSHTCLRAEQHGRRLVDGICIWTSSGRSGANLKSKDIAPLSKSAVPKSAVPKSAVPKSAVPKSAVPKSAVPKSAVPKSAVPKSAVR